MTIHARRLILVGIFDGARVQDLLLHCLAIAQILKFGWMRHPRKKDSRLLDPEVFSDF